MYKWKIEVILNSGKELTMYYQGKENTSVQVMNQLIKLSDCDFAGFDSKDDTANIFVKIGDISAVSISAA